MANDFKKVFKGIDQAIKTGTSRALNKAVSSARARITKRLREETGLTNKQIYTRIREVKSNVNNLGVKLGIATKVGISLGEFKPQVKKNKVIHKGNQKPTTHYGVSVKIGSQSRQLVPGGWLSTVRSGKQLVLSRKGTAKYPTQALRTRIFSDVAKDEQIPTQKHLVSEFDKVVADQIDYEIQKKFDSNK